MNQLIIYSHYSPFSFNCAIKDVIVDEANKLGVNTVLRDLYHMHFNPLLDNMDMLDFNKGNTPKDVEIEQSYITNSDIVIFVFPIWWNSFPAMIKGYIDRVLSRGFAYDLDEKAKIVGLLKGKKVMVFNSLGGKERPNYNEAFRLLLDKGIFEYCGFDILLHKFYPEMLRVDEKVKLSYLEDVRKRYREIIEKALK